MEFNQEVHTKLDAIFQKYNLKVIEESKNYLKTESPYLIIIIVYDFRENSNNIYLITKSSKSYTIGLDNEMLKTFFKSNLRLSSSNTKNFISTLATFFDQVAKQLLLGNIDEIIKLEEYSINRDKNYNSKYV